MTDCLFVLPTETQTISLSHEPGTLALGSDLPVVDPVYIRSSGKLTW